MAQAIELVPLVCIRCNTAIPANPEEVAWVCAQCGQGNLLDEEHGLVPVQVNYSASLPPNAKGKPFWVTDGQVTLQRETYSGNRDREAQQFWSEPHRFYVPAFSAPLETLLGLSQGMLLRPPALQPGAAASFEPVTLALVDLRAAVDFIIMAVEAGRKDTLKQVDFEVKLTEPALWVLP